MIIENKKFSESEVIDLSLDLAKAFMNGQDIGEMSIKKYMNTLMDARGEIYNFLIKFKQD